MSLNSKNNLSTLNANAMASHQLVMLILLSMALSLSACDQAQVQQTNAEQTKIEQTDSQPSVDASKQSSLKVVSPDWGNAATLVAMGYPPLATGDIRVWDQWVGEPKLPNTVVDLGIRYQPNTELVAQLPVDMVVDNAFYQHARSIYGENVPAESVSFIAKGKIANWSDYSEPTRQLGKIINHPQMAEAYINNSKVEIAQAGKKFNQRYPQAEKFTVVQFIDANNLRMYANNSLFQPALDQMGKKLVSKAEGNGWGFVQITMADLARLDKDVCLLVINPLSPITRSEIEKNLIWQRLDYGNTRCYGELPPVWIYGGMASLVTLANNLADVNLSGGVAQ